MVDWYSFANNNKNGNDDDDDGSWNEGVKFDSRRSAFVCRNGCVSSSQPLASSLGLQILWQGGNAADAAVAVAAALAVLEPCCTGLGGDMFALFYRAKDDTQQQQQQQQQVYAINGSGKCPQRLTADIVHSSFPTKEEIETDWPVSAHAVTVPMAARGWEETWNRFGSGKLSFADLLEPAAKMAEDGFPVAHPWTTKTWSQGWHTRIKPRLCNDKNNHHHNYSNNSHPLRLDDGNRAGQIKRNPDMAQVLRDLGRYGATDGFYQGRVGKAIVAAVQKYGGLMTEDDLSPSNTQCTFPTPISATFQNKVRLWQVPPNGQGIAGLIALQSFDSLQSQQQQQQQQSSQTYIPSQSESIMHAMIEMMRLGFQDARSHVSDPDFPHPNDKDKEQTLKRLLSKERTQQRANQLFHPNKAVVQGMPDTTSSTVSFQVVDKEGNAISFVNSNFMGFGTGIVPDNCGFTLQNRGYGFCIDDPNHPNYLQPGKRPFHTIIPGILTHVDTNELYATLSNMGGYMQPQGHFQLTVNMVAGGLDAQQAIDQPRFCIADGTHNGKVLLEHGYPNHVVQSLSDKGHNFQSHVSGYGRVLFGRAQIIQRNRQTGVLTAGSDGRADGCAMGY